jgi:hypothetical protein
LASAPAGSGCSGTTRARDSSAPLTANDGFSVVAPTSTRSPLLDVRQERVLLRLVEAVDLVDEQQRAAPVSAAAFLRFRDRFAHLRDAGEHRRERLEVQVGVLRDQQRQRGLADARRPPQQQRAGFALFDRRRSAGLRRRPDPGRGTRPACAAACARQAAAAAPWLAGRRFVRKVPKQTHRFSSAAASPRTATRRRRPRR